MKNKRKSKVLQLAKGFRNARSTKYKQAKQGVIRAGQHAFAHRRKKKRVMRKGWQIKINYAVRDLAGISYSVFMDMVHKKNIAIDRKIMCELVGKRHGSLCPVGIRSNRKQSHHQKSSSCPEIRRRSRRSRQPRTHRNRPTRNRQRKSLEDSDSKHEQQNKHSRRHDGVCLFISATHKQVLLLAVFFSNTTDGV